MADRPAMGRCYLDTNIFIGAFEKAPEHATPFLHMFDQLRAFPGAAVPSELTLAELFVLPSRPPGLSVSVQRRLYLELLVSSNFIDLRPVTRGILLQSADLPRLKDQTKHSLPGAIHVATAMEAGCAIFMTEDKRIRSVNELMQIIRPDPSGIATLLDILRA